MMMQQTLTQLRALKLEGFADGLEEQLTQPGVASLSFEERLSLLVDRSAGKATIVTSQLPIEHWHGWIGDETIADAMLDRLMQRHHRITLTGESLRKTSPKPNIPEPELDQN